METQDTKAKSHKQPLPRLRLSLSEVQTLYGVSRSKLEGLIAQGYLVPERITGKGKRYVTPAAVEALFRKPLPRQGKEIDLGAIGDEAYFRAFGVRPKRRHSSVQ